MPARPVYSLSDWRCWQADWDSSATGYAGVPAELNTARSYATREPSSLDEDRPVNPHALPKSYGAGPPL